MKMFHRAFLMLSMLIVAAALTGGAAPSTSTSGSTVPPSSVPAIPEPAALAVFGVGAAIVGVAIHRRRRR